MTTNTRNEWTVVPSVYFWSRLSKLNSTKGESNLSTEYFVILGDNQNTEYVETNCGGKKKQCRPV